MARRFELPDGERSLFWEVEQAGAAFTIRYGRVGAVGTEATLVAPSEAAATAEIEDLCRAKRRARYREVGLGVGEGPPEVISTAEHMTSFGGLPIVDFAPDAEPWESKGGLRSTVATLRELDRRVYGVRVYHHETTDLFDARLDALLAHPDLGELRGLVIGSWFTQTCDRPADEVVARLLAAAPRLRKLERLFIADVTQEESEISWIHQVDLAPLLHALPSLRVFGVRGGEGLAVEGLSHPELRELVVQTGGLSSACLRQIAAAELPELRSLTVWLGSADYGGDWTFEDLAPILDGARLPRLRHLGLLNSDRQDEVAEALAGAPILARLAGLDLSMGTLGDLGAAALHASGLLPRLEYLHIRRHYLSEGMVDHLSALPIQVEISDRQDDGEQRYTEVSE